MNKKLVITIIIIAALFFYLLFIKDNKIKYNPSKAESIEINETVIFLEQCRNTKDLLRKLLCPEMKEIDFYKLIVIDNIRANKLCSFSLSNETTNNCSINNYADVQASQELWKLDYNPPILGKITNYTLTIITSEGNYFLIKEGYSKERIVQKTDIFILEPLDKETIEILRA